MPVRASQLVSLLVVLIIVLSDILLASPALTGIEAARVEAPVASSDTTAGPALASNQSRRRHDRKQERRKEQQQDRKRKRNQADQQRETRENRAKARTGTTRLVCEGADIVPIRGQGLCTHGPDAAPPGLEIDTDLEVPADDAPAVEAEAIACEGDGVSGNRTQVLYVRSSSTPATNFDLYRSRIQGYTAEMDTIFRSSSMQTGPVRSVRFVQDPETCLPTVLDVEVAPTAINGFSATINQLVSKGYSAQNRIYLMFVDANAYCGIGTFGANDEPYANNENNFGPSYARVDRRCWSGTVAAHEVMHNLGGVQYSAPHTSGGAHCIDEWDIMCYSDSPRYPQMQIICPLETDDDYLLDCNHDDYFNTNPAPGSYLATHWNPANNSFLTNAAPLPLAPPPPVTEPDKKKPSGRGQTNRKQQKKKHTKKRQDRRNRNDRNRR